VAVKLKTVKLDDDVFVSWYILKIFAAFGEGNNLMVDPSKQFQ